ncbi:MAG: hypothetical protein E7813_20500 [Bradyrhizobium sp.]|uniref:DUF6445 family protein n=1 Tax=Bradyrhizobium sp. TaxID=376 RepID=UPI001223ABCF|nr:DUF6445 family protein [Bradyrhizobium sp.]THD62550.1 MAG: hypothetical protein E7813_20500 [Bradyrhizobium sp.]
MLCNTQSRPIRIRAADSTILVWDNFLIDPGATRRKALLATYFKPLPAIPWFVADRQPAGLKRVVNHLEAAIGASLYDWNISSPRSTICKFMINCAAAKSLIRAHADPFDLAAVLYLNERPPSEAGTTFFWRESSTANAPYSSIVPHFLPNVDRTTFKPTLAIPNVFNRLVCYDGALIHSATGYFGTTKTSGRLVASFFFNRGTSKILKLK